MGPCYRCRPVSYIPVKLVLVQFLGLGCYSITVWVPKRLGRLVMGGSRCYSGWGGVRTGFVIFPMTSTVEVKPIYGLIKKNNIKLTLVCQSKNIDLQYMQILDIPFLPPRILLLGSFASRIRLQFSPSSPSKLLIPRLWARLSQIVASAHTADFV